MIANINIDTAVFNDVYLPHLSNNARTQILYGGSSSGKSVFVAQRCIYDILRGGRNYLICRAVGRDSRRSTFVQINRTISEWGVNELFTVNKSEMVITCANGYQILFAGLDDTEKLKSIVPQKDALTDIWIEEATQTHSDAVKQLYKRQRGGRDDVAKRMTLSFNPIVRTHWIHKDFFEPNGWRDNQTEYAADDLTILKTTYKDNKFLTDGDIYDLVSEQDEYYYNVYTLGNWGVLGDVIFKNLEVANLDLIKEQFTNTRYGLDFGYSSDPAALVCAHYDKRNKTIYIFNEYYATEQTNDLLAADIKPLLADGYVTCDSAEPKSIKELQNHGVDARGARKGKDSVLHGIQWLQQHKIIIDERCMNTQNEFNMYQWAKDKDGNSLPRPIDKNNHIIDALRYAFEQDMRFEAVTVENNPFYG